MVKKSSPPINSGLRSKVLGIEKTATPLMSLGCTRHPGSRQSPAGSALPWHFTWDCCFPGFRDNSSPVVKSFGLSRGLSVRRIDRSEFARFDVLLDEHHWLGRGLVGGMRSPRSKRGPCVPCDAHVGGSTSACRAPSVAAVGNWPVKQISNPVGFRTTCPRVQVRFVSPPVSALESLSTHVYACVLWKQLGCVRCAPTQPR